MRIILSKAAQIITKKSGHLMKAKQFSNHVTSGAWKFSVKMQDGRRCVLLSDIEKFSKTYAGLKRGRPFKNY